MDETVHNIYHEVYKRNEPLSYDVIRIILNMGQREVKEFNTVANEKLKSSKEMYEDYSQYKTYYSYYDKYINSNDMKIKWKYKKKLEKIQKELDPEFAIQKAKNSGVKKCKEKVRQFY